MYRWGAVGVVDAATRTTVAGARAGGEKLLAGMFDVTEEKRAEQAMRFHAGLLDRVEAAVIGIPDDLWGELVVAVVVPAGADEGADVAALDSHARAHLAGYKIPRRYIVADELPRNAYGKVVKRDLRAAVADGTLS